MFSLNAVGAGCYVLHGPPQIKGLDHNPMHNTKMIREKIPYFSIDNAHPKLFRHSF
jgi:hypothetical protein